MPLCTNILHRFNALICILLLSVLAPLAFANNPVIQTLKEEQADFDIKSANKQFDQLNLKLSVENLNIDHLDNAITLLNSLMGDANTCIEAAQKKLSTLDPLISDATHAKETDKANADLVYLHKEQKKITTQLSQCRLFSIRAQEAVTTYKTTVNKMRQAQTLTRGLPIWGLIQELHQNPNALIDGSYFKIKNPLNMGSQPLNGSLVILSILFASLFFYKINHSSSCKRVLRVKKIGFANKFLLTLCLFGSAFTLSLHTINSDWVNSNAIPLLQWMDCILAYLWGLAFVVFLFKSKAVSAFFYWYSLDSHFFKSLIIFLLTYYALSIINTNLMETLVISDLLRQLGEGVFLLGTLITAEGFFYYFCKIHQHIRFIHHYRRLLQRTSALLFLMCAIINILGYHALAMHLTYAGITTFAILFTAILIEHATNKIYLLCSQPGKYHQKIRYIFGYKPNQTLVEFLILKTTLQLMILIVAVYLIGESWGYGADFVDSAYSQLLNGIHFTTFTFYPTRIVAGIVVFCVLYLIFRAISTELSQHAQFEDEEETQVAVASILTYVGFACALIAALYISGIDFTGLAIVAGALSVGIGLGLQSIVNNFVSGIILLIEKPIKPGDRIRIDGVEGTVKKISVRSTQLTTSAREDVIIPNSDLITHPVTNFMFSDTYLSIHCEVGVAYNSDPQLVKHLLLQATQEHDEIIKTARSKPSVLFEKFGDSAMIFQIWFVIRDGNKKSIVQSEINFSIERLFREHHIHIACPQRDINIKVSDMAAFNTNNDANL